MNFHKLESTYIRNKAEFLGLLEKATFEGDPNVWLIRLDPMTKESYTAYNRRIHFICSGLIYQSSGYRGKDSFCHLPGRKNLRKEVIFFYDGGGTAESFIVIKDEYGSIKFCSLDTEHSATLYFFAVGDGDASSSALVGGKGVFNTPNKQLSSVVIGKLSAYSRQWGVEVTELLNSPDFDINNQNIRKMVGFD